jgi:hypothetical protein
MKTYKERLWAHLGKYANERLGVFESGIYDGRRYRHILPSRLRFLNLLEAIRSEMQEYLRRKPVKLHQYFNHLNSSQALAFNLYPYFSGQDNASRALSRALGFDERVLSWDFEHVPDAAEGTNTDVMWRISDSASIFCEVKLSEAGFGTAKNDERHRNKLLRVYQPRLEPLIANELLKEDVFFKNYQLLRNISLLAENPAHHLVILFPRENKSLEKPLRRVLDNITNEKCRKRISKIYLEDCLTKLQNEQSISELRFYAFNLAEKYVPALNMAKKN